MFHLALKSIRARKMRLVLTSMAIIVSIGFVAGTLMLSSTISEQIGEVKPPPGAPDVQITTGSNSVVIAQSAEPVPASLVDDIERIDGVDRAEGVVQGFVNRADGSFQPLALEGWRTNYQLKSGKEPDGPAQVAASEAMAAVADLDVGDTLKVVVPGGELRTLKVAGIYWYGKDDPANRSLMGLAADTATARQLLGMTGRVSAIDVWADSGTTHRKLERAIRQSKLVPDGYRVRTFDHNFQQIVKANAMATSIITYILLGFAGLSLFVGIFMIFNTFSIIVAQRSRELGALRAIGASRKQVRRLVAVESTMVGFVGSIAGLAVGWCICALVAVVLEAFTGYELFAVADIVVSPLTIIICLLVGITVTRLAAALPARRASRISPIAALGASSDRAETRVPMRRALMGALMVLSGIAMLWASQINAIEQSTRALAMMLALGSVMILVGMIMVSPVLVAPMAWVYSLVLRKPLGMSGRLGLDQARGTPRRVAATSVTFMIGLGVVATVAMPLAAMQQQMGGDISKALRADLRVTNAAISPTSNPTLSSGAVSRISEADGVASVVEARNSVVSAKGDLIDVRIVDPGAYAQAVKLPIKHGASVDELDDNDVLVSASVASSRKLDVGETMRIKLDGKQHELRVAGIHEGTDFLTTSLLLSDAAWARLGGEQLSPGELLVTAARGTDPEKLKRTIVTAIESDFPTTSVRTERDMREQAAGSVKMIFFIILGLCGAALTVALFGIANTVALSLHERTRELGMLRAIGMTRRQMRRMVRWEAIMVGSFGSLMGITIGLILGSAIVLLSNMSDHIAVPWIQLVILMVLGMLAGVLASALPAYRTAKLDVLDAISSS